MPADRRKDNHTDKQTYKHIAIHRTLRGGGELQSTVTPFTATHGYDTEDK